MVHLLTRLKQHYPGDYTEVARHLGTEQVQHWRDALYAPEAPNPAYLTMMVATERFRRGESVSPDDYLPHPREHADSERAHTCSVEFQPAAIGEVGWLFDEGNQAPYLAEVFDTPLPEGRLPHVRAHRTWPGGGSHVIRVLGRQHSFVKRVPAKNKMVLYTAECAPRQQLLIATHVVAAGKECQACCARSRVL